MAAGGEQHYQPKDAMSAALVGTLTVGSSGLLIAAVKNSLAKRNVGPWAIFTRTGGLVATFAAVGGVYQFSRIAAANLREKDDHYNSAIGGFLAGSIVGIRTGRMPPVFGIGAAAAAIMAAFDYTGGTLRGRKRDPEIDEYERKEQLRKNRRRPLEETIADVGEGRSIQPPGYEERRRERLKEKYGIEINPVSVNPDA